MGAQIVNIHENIIKHFKTQKIVLGQYPQLRVTLSSVIWKIDYKELKCRVSEANGQQN